MQQNIPTQDSKSTRTFLHHHGQILIPIFWQHVEKADQVDFWEEDRSTSAGFHED